ncbi:MAG: tRNA (adenosine(37)-N6)-threonylcarbamoyltransferase complex ATPase subunit type 1 TsaE [Fimbriimonadaceae bacterium]|nr:MAG: tRNA (adenosine(37)-N6)-threonylcarbamoyltransferase complex ATPase subunit type 1 TsaE [Fimbriimonadaceae bacterium]
MTEYSVSTEKEMRELGSELTRAWRVGDIVLLSGELGAGKTTLVRGVLEALNWEGAVRSPSFTLMQVYPTKVPVLHADLYRLTGAAGIGLEEYFEDHLCLIEWPDRLGDLVDPAQCWRVQIDFDGEGRKVNVLAPSESCKFPNINP